MKTSSMLLGAVFAIAAFGAQAQDVRDAVAVDPEHHHVILENDRVRVFEVVADPGAKSPMHTHQPLVLISMSKARSRMTMPNGETAIFDLNPGQVLWLENAEHAWELLAGRVHVIAVEIK
jgi:quercetin dioxygenase-like cupin family protein